MLDEQKRQMEEDNAKKVCILIKYLPHLCHSSCTVGGSHLHR
jgi:hypothetical protein